MKQIFDKICIETSSEEPNSPSDLNRSSEDYSLDCSKKVTLSSLIKFARICAVMDNSLTWDDLLSIINETSNPKAQLTGNELFNFRDFKKIIFELSVKKYKEKIQDANVVCFEHLIDNNIRKNFDEQIFVENDEILDNFVNSLPAIKLLGKFKKQLQELFSVFSTIHVLAAHFPSWDDIVKYDYGVSTAEFIVFTQSFELTPNAIPRHAIYKKIVPLSFHHNNSNVDL